MANVCDVRGVEVGKGARAGLINGGGEASVASAQIRLRFAREETGELSIEGRKSIGVEQRSVVRSIRVLYHHNHDGV